MTDFLVDAARTEADSRNVTSLRPIAKRQVLVVAGMHRSGTSAFARLLGLLGAALPADMADGAEDNEAGFWEPLPIKEFDDELLAVAGSRWDDVIAVPTDWYESEAAGLHVARGVELLEKQYGDAPLFVLKDPRICRLLPFWQRVFVAAGLDARYVLPLRNPLEVAASLARRNGFATEKSLLLWLEHVLSAELWTRGLPRTFPRYEHLLENPHGVVVGMGESLGLAWPRLTARTRREIDRFLARDLRHHAFEDHELGARAEVAAWVTRTYGAVLNIASGSSEAEAEYEVLDHVAAEFREADAAYGSLVAALEVDLGVAQQEAREAGRRVEELGVELAAADADRERLAAELEARLAAHSDDLRELGRLQSELDGRGREVDALEAERKRQQDELEARLAAHSEDLTAFESERERQREELAGLESERERQREELEARLAAHSEDLAELGRISSQLEAAAAASEELQSAVAAKDVELAAAADERTRLDEQLNGAFAAREVFADELKRAHDRLDEQQRASAAAQEELDAASARAADAQALLEAASARLAEVEAERTTYDQELKRTLERLEEHDEVAAAEKALAVQEQARYEAELTRERESARTQLGAAARERDRLQGELEARVAEHSATLLELGRVRSELVSVQSDVLRNSIRGRLRRIRRWPLVRLYLLWVAIVPAGVRLRVRYASQLGSWLLRPTPTRLGWVRAYFSLRRSGAFDYRYYAHRYPEVIRARMNPLMHYIEHGAREGRDPSARFSTAAYLSRRPDLDPRRRNPLLEAQRRGEVGGSATSPETQPASTATEGAVSLAVVEADGPQRVEEDAPARPAPVADWRLPPAAGVDVICLPIIDWHYRFQRPQQLATQFAAAGHRVFYAETKFHGDGDDLQVDPIAAGVWGVRLPGVREKVIYTSTLEEAELERLLAALDAFRQVASVGDAVVVVDLPFWAPLALEAARRFGWRVIYDCMDHHTGFLDEGFGSAAVRIAIEENEEALLHESDAVLTTSRLLYDRVRPIARKTLLVPNGTDFAHFNRCPDSLAVDESVERPVVGYYGAISSWFDVELVATAARARPHWSFVLVGSTFGADVTALTSLPNVQLPGEHPYDEIPAYLHAFDVACIPFKLNALTEATNPVKFYEYLSAGKPIVAAALPELEPYEGYYYKAGTAEEFVAGVERALHEHTPDAAAERVALALRNTWSARWKELERLLRSWFGRAAIVILSYDNPEYLRLCLESIWAKTRYPNYDVYVVENGTNADVDAYLTLESETRERLHVIRPGENLGFARANNLAVELAGDCEYVVLLNDDVVVTEGWLAGLLRHLEDESVGIVGPVTNWTGNEARVDVDYEGVEGMDDFAARYTTTHAGKTFDINSLAMYCVAVRRRLYDSLGRLDERFEIGMFEDDDFAQRVRDAGLRVICGEDVFVHHWGRASFSRMEQDEYDAIFEANRVRFEEKWGRAWEPHRSR